MHSSQRIEAVQTPVIPVIGEWIARHPGTISLGQGVVHYGPPKCVFEAVAQSAGQLPTSRYGLVCGRDELLEAAQEKLHRENAITSAAGSDAGEASLGESTGSAVVWTAGSNMAFINAVLAVADSSDEIILLSPYYFNHEMAVDVAGCRVVSVATNDQYQLDVEAIRRAITPRTRAVVTVSPNNPTGAVYSKEALIEVNQLCGEQGIYHISDEAYEYFVYGGQSHFSPGSLPDSAPHTISLFSLSKAYGMAGWRIGYMVIPRALETHIKKIQDTILICPPMISQVAALSALTEAGGAWVAEQTAGFNQVREMVLHELHSMGDRIRVPQPDGAFYALVKVDTDQDDMSLIHALIQDFGIAVMPGSTFNMTEGCSLRIAFGALQAETVAEGMSRFKRGIQQLI